MKKSLIFLAAIALLSVQNAGAWGYKNASDGWSAVLTTFARQDHFFSSTQADEPDQWDVLMGTNPGAGFNITQDNYGNGMRLYVGLDGIAATSTNTIVRAVVKWDNIANTMFTNPTVVIPDGKIYVMVDGVKYLMTNKVNYQFEAIVQLSPTTTALTVLGDAVNPTNIIGDNGLTPEAVPTSMDLLIPNVPVSTTANKIRVQFNLWKNQVTISDFVSEVCNWAITPAPAKQSDWALFTWETLPNGNVEISIKPDPANAGTANDYAFFRGNGMGGGSHTGFTINGVANALGSYFNFALHEATSMPAGQQFYDKVILTPKAAIAEGTIIQFSGQVEYKTTNVNGNGGTGDGGNLYPNISMPAYTYGTNCSGIYALKLATPTNVSVDATGNLTFTEVANAENYLVTVTFNGAVLGTYNVSGSGTTLNFPFSGTFTVTVIAIDNDAVYANSDPSTPFTWIFTATDQTVGSSPVCQAVVGDAAWGLNISIETATAANGDILPGDIVFTLTGTDASFRNLGAQLANMKVNGIPAVNILTKVTNPGGSNAGQPLIPQNVFRPISGLSIAKGTAVTYNGEMEARTAANTNIWGVRVFNYIYGTACTAPILDPPTNLVLTGNNLGFTPAANAASTTIFVMLNGVVIMTIPNFTPGDPINIPVNGTFTIVGQSISGDPTLFANSDLSQSVTIVVNIADQTVDYSSYCNYDLPNPGQIGTTGVTPNVSLETATNGDITVKMNGDNVWRNGGININGWYIGGVKAAPFLDEITLGTENPQIFRPKANITIPKGALVSYICSPGTASWEWGPGNGWQDAQTIFSNYQYGSICLITDNQPQIDNQKISLLNTLTDGVLYFANANNANVVINDLSGKTVLRAKVSNSQINVSALAAGVYLLNIDNHNFKFIKK